MEYRRPSFLCATVRLRDVRPHPDVSVPLLLGELWPGAGSDPTAGKELPFRNGLIDTKDELKSVGIDFDYRLNDSWTMNVDLSTAESAGGNGDDGAIYDAISIGGQAVAMQWMDFRTDITQSVQAIADGSGPTTTMVGSQEVAFAGGNANGVFEKSDLGSQWILKNWGDQESTIDQAHFKFAWDNGGPLTANFGLGYYDNEIIQDNVSTRRAWRLEYGLHRRHRYLDG